MDVPAEKHKEQWERVTAFRRMRIHTLREDVQKAVGADRLLPANELKQLQRAILGDGARRFATSFGQKQRRHRKQMKHIRSH